MRLTKKETVTKEVESTIDTKCDICGESFNVNHIDRVEVTRTQSCTDGGICYHYDICLKCWNSIITPLMKTGPERIDF